MFRIPRPYFKQRFFSFSSKKVPTNSNKIPPRPRNPTMSESFGSKFSSRQVETLLDPLGFILEAERPHYLGLDAEKKLNPPSARELIKIEEDRITEEARRRAPKQVSLKEYGLRKKTNDPTRYGEWDIGGRTYDF